jgi:hypothetical protein
MRKENTDIPFETLHRLYIVEGLDTLAVARTLGRRNTVILAALQQYGLVRKPPSREYLLEHYVRARETPDEIGERFGLTAAAIRHHLRKHRIPVRKRGVVHHPELHSHDWLLEHYVTNHESLYDIAALLGVRVSSVVRALIRHDVRRDQREHGSYYDRFDAAPRRQFVGQVRARILERDGYSCRWPECGTRGPRLHVHHIVRVADGGPDTEENGITLCETHHLGIAGRERDYITLFSSIVQGPLT